MNTCSKCGTKNEKEIQFCLHCGHKLGTVNDKGDTKQMNIITIISVIIGIISLLWSTSMILNLKQAPGGAIEAINNFADYQEKYFAFVGFCFGYTLFSFTPSIIGLVLGILGNIKQKSKVALAATIMNLVAIISSLFAIVYIFINTKI